MVKKANQSTSMHKTASLNPIAVAENIKASAQQIYLAGLAQFAKAQQEGGKVFEGLVKEGLAVQRKTQAAAEERLSEVAHRAAGLANEVAAKASGQWNKLEDIFEERVARALSKLGVPSAKEIEALNARVDALSKQLAKTGSSRASAARSSTPSVKAKAAAPAKKAPVKRTRKAA